MNLKEIVEELDTLTQMMGASAARFDSKQYTKTGFCYMIGYVEGRLISLKQNIEKELK